MRSLVFQAKGRAAKSATGFGAENVFVSVADGVGADLILVEIDEEIRFDEDLVVAAVHWIVAVVMSDEPRDAVDVAGAHACFCQKFAGWRWSFLLLQFAVAAAVFFLGGMDADVVHEGGKLDDALGFRVDFSPWAMSRA